MGPSGKMLAVSTLQQKLSHLNTLQETTPQLLPGPKLFLQNLAQGLGSLKTVIFKDILLPPSFLRTLANLSNPQMMHIAVQFQALTGLRGGQMVQVTPGHLKHYLTTGKLWLTPFKHQTLPILLDISHVPSWLVSKFLALGKQDYVPILTYTVEQYREAFKRLTDSYHLPHTSHAARHLFASMMKFLNVIPARITQGMTHKAGTSLSPYLHAFSLAEQRVILDNPGYFVALKGY